MVSAVHPKRVSTEKVEELSGQQKAQELPTSHQICLMLANLYYQGEPHKAHCCAIFLC